MKKLVLLAAAALLFLGCNFMNYPLDEFHAEQTGRVSLGSPASPQAVVGSDGVICIAPGTQEITIPINNPAGLTLREAGLVSGTPAGVTAQQSPDKNAIILTLPASAALGDDYQLTLNLVTDKEGRVLAQKDIEIECIDFRTTLNELKVNGTAPTGFVADAAQFESSLNNFTLGEVTIGTAATSSAATVRIVGDIGGNKVNLLNLGNNDVVIQVISPHEALSSQYVIHIICIPAGSPKDITSFTLAATPGTIFTTSPTTGTIEVILPAGTAVTSLTPVVTISGASYSPAGAQNFTNAHTTPIEYTVTASDISTKVYAVTVHVRPGIPTMNAATNPATQQLRANWQTVLGASTYDVYYNTTGAPPNWETTPEPGLSGVSGTSKDCAGLTNGTLYYMWVRGKTAAGITGDWSVFATGIPGVTTREELSAAITAISEFSSGTVYIAGLNNTLTLTMTSSVRIYRRTITLMPIAGKTVTLKRGSTHAGALLQVNDGGTLNLGASGMSGTLVLDGGAVWTDSNGDGFVNEGELTYSGTAVTSALVSGIGGNGAGTRTLNMYEGVILQNNMTTTTSMPGTQIAPYPITYGGGVYFRATGQFTMYGGTIQQNEDYWGGGVSTSGGAFTMEGGVIARNLTTSDGGGVYLSTTAFTMNAGSITLNRAGGGHSCVFNSGGTVSGTFTGITGNYWEDMNW
jgi:hypothetical protein